jgi:glycosyltransferase involved in cell wall biosynthesis
MTKVPVLHIITRLIIGGAQENTMLTADLLDPERYTVDVVSGPQTGSEGSLIEEVRARGIPLTIQPNLVREVNPLKDLPALLALYRHIGRGRYAIVHTHSGKAGMLGRWAAWLAGLAGRAATSPRPIIIHTVHGWSHHERQHPLARRLFVTLERLTARVTDKLIVVSPTNIEKGLADRIATPGKYVTIRSGIDLDRFRCPERAPEAVRDELGVPQDTPVVGSVTRLSEQKAPLDFVTAAAQVARQRPDVHFVVVGDGSLRQQVEEAIAAHGLTGYVHLTGLRRDVPDLMHSFDIFALSSLWEGLPRVLPQAMAAALPIVATAVDGNAEAVTDGVNGLLTPPGDPAALTGALVKLLDDPDRAHQMGQAGLAMVEAFSARKMVDDIEALYEDLLAQRSQGPASSH